MKVMPLMSRDDHENLLSELLAPEIEHSRKSEILQQLRVDHGTAHAETNELTEKQQKLQKERDDLVVSNSQLFRQLGTEGNPEKKEEVEQKEFSETVTLEDFEKTY
jgi:hypothetical protein